MPEFLTDPQGGKCLYAPFTESATPSSYVWEKVLPDAYFAVAAVCVKTDWSAATVNLKLELNDVAIVADIDPWTVNGQPFYLSTSTIGTDILNGIAVAGDTLRFTLRSPNSTAETGHAYFFLHVVPFSPVAVTVQAI